MKKTKKEFLTKLAKLAESEPSSEELYKGIELFAGGDIDWISKLVKKHIIRLLEETNTKCEQKQASPSIVLRVLVAILKLQIEEIENAAAKLAEKELEYACKSLGVPKQELEKIINKKSEVTDYIG